MLLPSLIQDNIAELLVEIIEFTQARHRILTDNIKNYQNDDFLPMDLATDEFSILLHNSINEHVANQRLVMFDTDHIKFGSDGTFEAIPRPDEYASELLRNDPEQYLDFQIDNLMENMLNQKIATELLNQKQQAESLQ